MSPRTWIESTNIPKCVNLNRKPSGGHSSGVIVDKNSRDLTADKWKYLIPLCFRFRLKLLFIKRVRVRMCEFERETQWKEQLRYRGWYEQLSQLRNESILFRLRLKLLYVRKIKVRICEYVNLNWKLSSYVLIDMNTRNSWGPEIETS